MACSFDNSLPVATVVTCGPNGECPQGRTCDTLSNECRLDGAVGVPTLTSSVPSPAIAPRGAVVSFTVTSSEALRDAPRLVLRHSAGTVLAAAATGADADFTHATYAVTVDDTLGEGLVTVYADATSVAGAAVSGVKLESFLVDATPPTLVRASVTPSVVAPGGTVLVRAEFSESLAAGARVHVNTGLTELEVTPVSEASGLSLFSFDVPAGTADGVWKLTLQGVKDLAGNAMADAPLQNLTVDATPPDVGVLGLEGKRFSAQPGFNTFQIPVVVDGATSVKVCVGSRPCQSANSGDTVSVTVTSADTEGSQQIVVRATDAAGNVASVSETVIYDFTPPRLLTSAVQPVAAPRGTHITVSAQFSEAVADEIRLGVQSPDATPEQLVVGTQNSAGQAAFAFDVAPTAIDGTWPLTFRTVRDLAGNPLAATALTPLTVDSRAPTIGALGLRGRRFSTHAPFNTFAIPITVDESATVELCIGDRPCQTVTAGTSVTATVTASDTEGPQFIVVRATDAAGNHASLSEPVVYDFTGPTLTSTRVETMTPPQGCLLPGVSALTVGATHTIEFASTETLSADPQVTAGTLAWAKVSSSGTSYIYALTVGATVTSQSANVSAHLIDDVGNASDQVVRVGLPIDVDPPPALGAAEQAALTYQRIPWGAEEGGYATRYSVSGGPGASTAGDSLVFFDGNSLFSPVLGQAAVAADGSLARVVFSRSDRKVVYVHRFDRACNAAPGAVQTVHNVEWVATTGKPPGSPTSTTQVQWREKPTLGPTAASLDAPAESWARRSSGPVGVRTGLGTWRNLGGVTPGGGILSGRYGHATAWDPLRRRIVVFGGSVPTNSNDTWYLDDFGWKQIATPSALTARANALLAFDPRRGQLVLFGGMFSNTQLTDTWALDGDTWTPIVSPVSPPGRNGGAMVWDDRSARLVLVAGNSRSETWVLEAAGWRQLTTPSPPARFSTVMTWDPKHGRVVLCGGSMVSGIGNDTWVLEGDVWRQLPTPPGFGGRADQAMVWDAAREQMVLFGGRLASTPLGDAWVMHDDLWVQDAVPVGLTPRTSAAMVYDKARRRVMMFGGQINTAYATTNETWVRDDSGWSLLATTTPPPARRLHSMVYDPVRGAAVVFAGVDNSSAVVSNTSIYDETGWHGGRTPPFWSQIGRYQHALVWDPVHDRAVSVSGAAPGNSWYGDSATFDGTTWVNFAASLNGVSTAPMAAFDPSTASTVMVAGSSAAFDGTAWRTLNGTNILDARGLVFDEARGAMIAVDGLNTTSVLDGGTWVPLTTTPATPPSGAHVVYDKGRARPVLLTSVLPGQPIQTYALTGASWVSVATSTPGPMGRDSQGVVYDEVRDRTLVFSGFSIPAYDRESWVLNGSTWSQIPVPSTMRGRLVDALTYDSRRGRVVVFGGRSDTGDVNDTWVLDGQNWRQVVTPPLLTPRDGAKMVFDALRGNVMLVGGQSNRTYAETWVLEDTPGAGPADAIHVDASNLLPDNATVLSMVARVGAAGYSAVMTDELPAGATLMPDGGARLADGGTRTNPDGGTFFATAVPVAGARLESWDPLSGERLLLAQNTTSTRDADGGRLVASDGGAVSTVTELTATVTYDGGIVNPLQPVMLGNALRFQVTPVAGPTNTGARFTPAEIATDGFEVRVRYSVP